MVISTFILSDIEQQVLKMYIEELSNFKYVSTSNDCEKIIQALKESSQALIFVDLDFINYDFEYICKLHEIFPKLKIVTFCNMPNVDLTVKSLRVGAVALISMPFIKSEILALTSKIEDEFLNNIKEKSKCRVITVFSNKGGIGKTSIASNLALELAKISKEDVALVDLNFQLGDITTFWNIKPSFDMSYVINNLDNINKDFLLNTLETYENTSLHILADPPYFKSAETITVKQIDKLFTILKETFAYVIIDTSASIDDKTMTAIKNSDLTLLVTVSNLPALRNCQRCLDVLSNQVSDRKSLRVLVNRYMENDEIGLEDIEKVLGEKIFAKIPNNYFTMMSAINKGVPVCEINQDSNVAKAYNELALNVSDFVYGKK